MGKAVGKAKAPHYNRSCFGWPPASTATLTPSTSVSLGPLVQPPSTHAVISALEVYRDNKDFPLQRQQDALVDAEQHPGGTCKLTVKVNNYFLILYA